MTCPVLVRRLMVRLRRALPLAPLCLVPALGCAAATVEDLLAELSRPAPATTPFVEARFSKLLNRPIVVKGQLEYHEDGTLVRAVHEPFRERTEIRGDAVTVERVGKATKHFSLQHTPELRSMLASFSAILGGDRSILERDFDLAVQQDAGHWRLEMTPRAQAVRQHVRDIVMQGQGDEPRCIAVTQADAGASIMLVGQAAEMTLPQPLTREWLDRFCAAGGS